LYYRLAAKRYAVKVTPRIWDEDATSSAAGIKRKQKLQIANSQTTNCKLPLSLRVNNFVSNNESSPDATKDYSYINTGMAAFKKTPERGNAADAYENSI
jgi:hypothetical protein